MFSDKLSGWFNNFSQSAAQDMCEGGDDKGCVAETCIDCLSSYDKVLHAELRTHIDAHGYQAVLTETMKHVCTL